MGLQQSKDELLYEQVGYGNVEGIKSLHSQGASLEWVDKEGKTSLIVASNALVMNDDCQSPLDVARVKGHCNVVRAIERHICLFSGWLREFYGPGFLEVLAPQLVSRKVYV